MKEESVYEMPVITVSPDTQVDVGQSNELASVNNSLSMVIDNNNIPLLGEKHIRGYYHKKSDSISCKVSCVSGRLNNLNKRQCNR